MVYKSINEVLLKTTKKYPNKIIFEEMNSQIIQNQVSIGKWM